MSKTLFVGLLTAAQMTALHQAGHVLAAPTQQAVAALMQLPIAQTVASDIATLRDASLSGVEKFEKVVAKTAPALVELFAGKGVTKTVDEVFSIAREFVQTVFNATTSTTAGTVALDVLKLLGIA